MTTVEARTIDSEEARVNEAVDTLLAEFPPGKTDEVTFLGAPVRPRPGLGALPRGRRRPRRSARSCRRIVNERICAAGGPIPYARNPIGYGMGAPDGRRPRHRRPAEAATCARCSPARRSGASCSASRAPAPTSPASSTKAVRDGDEWIVNGQKVWTTLAHLCALGHARRPHRPRAARSTGASPYFVVDMHGPGRRGAAAAPDDRRGRVQRGVLHRRAHPRRRAARRRRRRAGGCRSPRS